MLRLHFEMCWMLNSHQGDVRILDRVRVHLDWVFITVLKCCFISRNFWTFRWSIVLHVIIYKLKMHSLWHFFWKLSWAFCLTSFRLVLCNSYFRVPHMVQIWGKCLLFQIIVLCFHEKHTKITVTNRTLTAMLTASGKSKQVFNLNLWQMDITDQGIALSITKGRSMGLLKAWTWKTTV